MFFVCRTLSVHNNGIKVPVLLKWPVSQKRPFTTEYHDAKLSSRKFHLRSTNSQRNFGLGLELSIFQMITANVSQSFYRNLLILNGGHIMSRGSGQIAVWIIVMSITRADWIWINSSLMSTQTFHSAMKNKHSMIMDTECCVQYWSVQGQFASILLYILPSCC